MTDPRHVLIVEDSKKDARLIEGALREEWPALAVKRVETAAALRGALTKEAWDCVLCDVVMPQFSAPAALEILRQSGLDVPFIVVSGVIDIGEAVDLMRAGAHDFIRKDDLARLAPAVRRELKQAETRRQLKRADEALHDSEQKYRDLVEFALDAIHIHCDGKIVFANSAAARLFGAQAAAQLIGQPVLDHIHPEDRKTARKRIREILEKGVTQPPLERRNLRLDGSPVDVEITANSTRWKGRPAVQVITRDITERKKQEQELAEKSALLQAVLEAMGQGLSAFDENLRLVAWNQVAMELLGYAPDFHRPGRPLEDFFRDNAERGEYGPGDVEELVRERMELARKVVPHRFERTRPDGTVIEVHGNPMPDGGFVTTYTDITERKRRENELAQKTDVLETTLENMDEGISLVDADLNAVAFNQRFLELLEFPADRFRPGDKFEDFIRFNAERGEYGPGDVEEMVREHLRQAKLFEPHRFERTRPDGTVIEVRGNPMPGGGFVTTYTDITERKQAEDSLREIHNRLRVSVDRMPIAYIVWDREFRVREWNPAAEKIFGFAQEELAGQAAWKLIVPDNVRPAVAETMEKLLAGEAAHFSGSDNNIRKNGEVISCQWFNTPLKDEAGRVHAVLSMAVDVTEQRQAGEALRQSEERFRTIVDTARDAIVTVDGDGRISQFNPAAVEMFGHDAGEAVGKSVGELLVPDEFREKHEKGLRKFLASGTGELIGRPVEIEAKRADGTTFPVELLLSAGDRAGERCTALIRDIAGRKRGEEALRESEGRLRTVVDTAWDGYWRVDDEFRTVEVNEALCRMLGYTRQEMIGRTPLDFTDERGREILEAELARRAAGRDSRYEITFKAKSGDDVHARVSPKALRDRSGRVIGSFGFVSDITGQRKVEDVMRKLSRAVEQSPAAVLITDVEGTIEYVNTQFTEITGYTFDEAVGQNPRMLKSDETSREVYERMWATIATGEIWRGTLHNKRKDGTVYLASGGISPILAADGTITHYVGTQQDITRRVETEQQLRQAQKMDAVGQLTGGVAHDFNNLLTVILGNLQLLERAVGDDERLLKRAAAATHAARRGAELTNRLLAFSRRQVLEPKVLDLNELVSGMNDLLRRTLGEDTEIETVPAADLWPTEVDPAQVETSLLNLAVNARDAMPDGGMLTIETANATLDEDYAASHEGVTAGDYVMVAVTDTGRGMPPDVAKQVFEPFFTTKKTGKGTGLGLSMVYGFVKQSGGSVYIYSEEGHGTTVKLYFPRSASPGAPAATEASGGEEIPRGTETVLVVEDDTGVREVTVAMLEEFGYRVLQAESGVDALAVLVEHADVELVLTDVVMPGGISGPALGKQVRKRWPRIKMLYASGYTHNAFVRNGKLDPNVRLISKPFQNDDLAREVRRILDGA